MKTKTGVEEMTTKKGPNVTITGTEKLIEGFKAYAKEKDLSYGELLQQLWDNFTGNDTNELDETPDIEFTFPKDEREKKEPVFREIFGLDKGPLKVSEKDLLQKACETSGKQVEYFSRNGRIMAAKQEIGLLIQAKAGIKKGKRGSADDKLIANLQYLVDNGIKLSVNKLVQVENTYRPTVIRFLKDNGLIIGTNGELDPDDVAEFLGKKDEE